MESTEKSYQILVGGSISDDPRGHRDIRPQSDPRKYTSMEIDILFHWSKPYNMTVLFY